MQSSLLITSFADQRCGRVFIDKTGMLSYLNEAIDRKERFHCVTMPSRFGKTYIADMVAAYYTNEGDSREAFKGLAIESDPSFEKHLNKHNVIKLDIGGICAFVPKEKAIESICGNILGYLHDHFPLTDVSGLLPAKAIARVNAKVGATFVFVIDEWDYLLRNHPEDVGLFDSYIGLLCSLFKNSEIKGAIDQFNGKLVDSFILNKAGNALSEEQIDTVSGASTSSQAVVNAVNAGLDFFNTVMKGGN